MSYAIVKCQVDVYANGVVCRAYILGTYHNLSVPAFSLPIHWASTELLRKSYPAPVLYLLHSRGVRCEDNVMFLPWEHCVDDSGIYYAPLLVPYRPLAAR